MPCYKLNSFAAVRFRHNEIFAFIATFMVLALAAGTTACNSTMQSMTTPTTSGSSGSRPKVPIPGGVKIQITPPSASVTSGGQLQFDAVLTNSRNADIVWTVSAGQITKNGLFTAPAVTSTKPITIKAASLWDDSIASAVVTVTPAAASNARLAISTKNMPQGTVGASYSTTLAGTGGSQPYRWTLGSGSLPAGLQLASQTGAISGTATKGGNYSFSVQIADASGNTASESFTLDVNAQEGSNCGPPSYPCSRSDLQLVTAKAPPQLGTNSGYRGGHLGAGLVAIDPAYNNRILRVTDGNTDSKFPGMSYAAGSSAEKSVTSYDETIFLVHNGSGEVCFYEFDQANFKAKYHGCHNDVGSGDFGYTEADNRSFYGYFHQKLYRWVIDTSNWTITSDPSFNNGQGFFDPDGPNCLNGQIAANKWYTGDGALSSDDSTVITAVGPTQDANPYFVIWNATNGCQWMNVKNWTVSHGWNAGMNNPTPIQFASGVTPKEQGGIHNAQIDRSGGFGVLTIHGVPSLQQKLFWTIGTNKIDDTCVHCMSHWACDFGVCFWSMGAGMNTGYNLVSQEIGKLQPVSNMDTSAVQGQWGDDEHLSHANAVQGERMIYLAAWQPGHGDSTVDAVWDDEVVGVNWDGMQRTIRFNKNWTSGYGGFNSSARCSISRQGHYAICGSDYEMYNLDKGFGNGKNQDTCDHNQPSGMINTNGCRTDVLLFELR